MKEYLKKLQKQRKDAYLKMQGLLDTAKGEERGLTDAEKEEYDKADKEYERLAADIKRAEEAVKREEELNKTQKPALVGGGNGGEQKRGENPADVDVDTKRYSLLKVVRALATGDWSGAEYERDLSLKIADKLGREAKGVFVPYEVQRQITAQRDAMATKAGTGLLDAGALVGTDHRDDLFIESLQAQSFVVANGAKVLTGLVGDVDIPRNLGGVSFDWIEEGASPNESATNLDTVKLTPKTIAGAVPITRRLVKQSSPAVEALIQQDIRRGVSLSIDKAVIAGTGGVQPTGILNTTGVGTVTIADTTNYVPTFEEAVKFETELAKHNALIGSPIYVTTPAIAGATKTKPIDTGSGIMLNTDNKINGYKVVATTLMQDNKTLFGNFGEVIIGMWGVMDLVVDNATLASSGGLVLRVFQDLDVAIRHPQSFAVSA